MDRPHRRARRAPGARLAGLVAALALLVAALALPSVHAAFSATTGTPTNSLAADRLQPPSGLVASRNCTYAPIVLRGALASTELSPLTLSPPPGTAAGDVLVAQVAYYGTSPITASLGIACQHGAGLSAAELLATADTALYAAKAGGRDQARMAGAEGPVSGVAVDEATVTRIPLPPVPTPRAHAAL